MSDDRKTGINRRDLMIVGAATATTYAFPTFAYAQPEIEHAATGDRLAALDSSLKSEVSMSVNGSARTVMVDNRTTLLDALRETMQLTGTKKGCDHGQCGACTVEVNGQRINSCLSLAVMHRDDEITSIEGLGTPDDLDPMQTAFIEHDGYQCGYCTPGQICSARATLSEIEQNIPSYVTADLTATTIAASDDEIRERMSGNICRCGAYANILAAINDVKGQSGTGEQA